MDPKAEHVRWMRQALMLAKQASQWDEVPVGATLVSEGSELGRAANANVRMGDPTAHAEILVLRQVVGQTGNHHLHDATLYVTLEPCLMCLGAIIQCQVQRIIFGAYDPKRGATGSALDILQLPGIDWHPDVLGGVLAKESGALLRDFFREQRVKG